jgi:hypothetical protein
LSEKRESSGAIPAEFPGSDGFSSWKGGQSITLTESSRVLYFTTKQPIRKGDNVEAYCVKCRKKVNMLEPKEETLKNGRRAMMGKCGACGTKLCRILGK